MTDPSISTIAFLFYLFASGVFWRQLIEGPKNPEVKLIPFATGATILAVLFQVYSLIQGLDLSQGIDLGLTSAMTIVTLIITILFLGAMLFTPMSALGIIVLPVATITLLIHDTWPSPAVLIGASPVAAIHILISLTAYGLLSLAAVQAILLLLQEHQLRHKHPAGIVRGLPPMEVMETLMVQIVVAGLVALTLTLFSGILFSEQVFGQALRFNHHILLAILAWLVYTIFLIGRWRLGWRGRTAIRWVLGGAVLLALGYFGTKFVLQFLVQRGA
ncbi:MAG: cytochrome c biogenesis protein CcsA [Gammaproteobacteria bacterium]|nr:MAG: cytochrome c biogenesis protein CcsA [Gammaproteobacteria bacterium]